MTDAGFTYLSWARSGMAATLPAPAGALAGAGAVATVDAAVTVNATDTAAVKVRLLGPGEVTGLDARQVVRTDPPDGALTFPPHLFPCVELDRPDLPWMFTPAGPSGQRLSPWLVLVTVPGSVTVAAGATDVLPSITVDVAELPPLDDAWAWAHVAVAQPAAALTGFDVNALQDSAPEQVVARLISPRRLRPERSYLACLVPAFAAGRQAGLGQPVTAGTLAPAWSGTAGQVTLPVYHSIRFHTGPGGDFRALALRLEERRLPAEASTRPIDVSQPGAGLPSAGDPLGLGGALRVPSTGPTQWEQADREAFQTALAPLLDAGVQPGPGGAVWLAPPLYGRWLAAHAGVPEEGDLPVWLRTLNLDPRHRAVAGFAARWIHDHAQRLMAQAWEQIDEVNAANELLRRAQLARQQAAAGWRRLTELAPEVALGVAGPTLRRVRLNGRTAAGEIATTSFPPAALSGAARRLARPRGALGRRLGLLPGAAAAAARRSPAPAPARPAAWAIWRGRHLADVIRMAPVVVDWEPLGPADPDRRPTGPSGGPTGEALRAAAVALERWRAALDGAGRTAPPALDLPGLASRVQPALDPDATVPARISYRIALPSRVGDPLEPVLASPRFPQPMWETLPDISRELLFPGMARIPPETVTLLETNSPWVAAYLVGLNHEMGRELLWNEYPTDQRGTCFRQFWDARARVPAPTDPTDTGPIPEWDGADDLGDGLRTEASRRLVLVLRGELLRRYPEATVYAVPAVFPAGASKQPRTPDADPTKERYPIFGGRLAPDVTFFGFDLDATQARGSLSGGKPGWFFVLQQHPTAPHFGLGEETGADLGKAPASWDQVTWGNVAKDAADLETMRYAPVTPKAGWFASFVWSPGPPWGADAAAMAVLTLQRPARVAIHAAQLLPEA